MSAKIFDFLILIGRFQPFHRGHLALVQAGLKQAERMILVCGSARQARGFRNPWNLLEREAMIRSALSQADNERVDIVGVADHRYQEVIWIAEVRNKVNQVVSRFGSGVSNRRSLKLALISQAGEDCDYYSRCFPAWGQVKIDVAIGVNGTAIREAMLDATDSKDASAMLLTFLPPTVADMVTTFLHAAVWRTVVEEQHYIAQYKQAWSVAPYTPTFVTVDALVVQGDHLLVVERKNLPGKGLLALPGGFVDPEEKLLDACLRELAEETCLDVHVSVLKQAITRREVFDDPYRSARGRTITHVFFMELPTSPSLPVVHGGDDARHAFWLPLPEIDPELFFEDHYYIIESLLGLP